MVSILGPDGQPVQANPSRTLQTAKLGHLQREVGDNPTNGLTPERLARILRRAQEGDIVAQCELADDMLEKDAHLFSETGKRIDAVVGGQIQIKPPEEPTPEEERATKLVQSAVDRLDFDDVLRGMMSGLLPGFAALEYHYEFVGGIVLPVQPKLRPHHWFRVNPDDHDELRLRDQSGDGQKLKPLNWIMHRHRAKHGYLGRSGLVRVLAWPFLLKALPVRDFAHFLEIYGIPIRIGKYPAGSTESEQRTLLRAVSAIGHSAAGIMPESMQIEIMNAASGSPNAFMAMMQWAEASQSKAILGGTLTTTAQATGMGSNLGDVQNECRKEIRDSDARQLEATLQAQFALPITRLNTTAQRPPRIVIEHAEYEDISVFADSLPKLAKAGMRISTRWAHDQLGIPEAKDDEPIIQAEQAPKPASSPSFAAATLEPVTPTGDLVRNPANIMADQLESLAANPLRAWLNQIEAVIAATQERGGTLTEVRDQLINMYGDLEPNAMRAALSIAMRAAAAAGVEDVSVESDAL